MDTSGSVQPVNLSTAIDVLNAGIDELQEFIMRLDTNADRLRGVCPTPSSAESAKVPSSEPNGEFDKLLQAINRFERYLGHLQNSVMRHEGI